ncbi:MAG: hypothetical protein ACKVP0_03015 [Pirellulaceae bacterium]
MKRFSYRFYIFSATGLIGVLVAGLTIGIARVKSSPAVDQPAKVAEEAKPKSRSDNPGVESDGHFGEISFHGLSIPIFAPDPDPFHPGASAKPWRYEPRFYISSVEREDMRLKIRLTSVLPNAVLVQGKEKIGAFFVDNGRERPSVINLERSKIERYSVKLKVGDQEYPLVSGSEDVNDLNHEWQIPSDAQTQELLKDLSVCQLKVSTTHSRMFVNIQVFYVEINQGASVKAFDKIFPQVPPDATIVVDHQMAQRLGQTVFRDLKYVGDGALELEKAVQDRFPGLLAPLTHEAFQRMQDEESVYTADMVKDGAGPIAYNIKTKSEVTKSYHSQDFDYQFQELLKLKTASHTEMEFHSLVDAWEKKHVEGKLGIVEIFKASAKVDSEEAKKDEKYARDLAIKNMYSLTSKDLAKRRNEIETKFRDWVGEAIRKGFESKSIRLYRVSRKLLNVKDLVQVIHRGTPVTRQVTSENSSPLEKFGRLASATDLLLEEIEQLKKSVSQHSATADDLLKEKRNLAVKLQNLENKRQNLIASQASLTLELQTTAKTASELASQTVPYADPLDRVNSMLKQNVMWDREWLGQERLIGIHFPNLRPAWAIIWNQPLPNFKGKTGMQLKAEAELETKAAEADLDAAAKAIRESAKQAKELKVKLEALGQKRSIVESNLADVNKEFAKLLAEQLQCAPPATVGSTLSK